ncbi:AMP-dependent synthetase and ligase [Emticicia oligotrophica DSM 17448]|uniref:AMP-dependent synthetase and ligase n=1 Tax=Emticicia oligotrophica (strain DSM 17448 / CIP 109782 / MTCC 6937 / GPTSA100-15) TaxID=929562 RepID=A0ABM5N023_EMTOG|nr:feruloyl-CoA synthase [Emticicia oligotrophica]AFK02738.1 AMP-dependent synthetase and ligase [Emticicia oligotrophica DSM 17448]
MYKNTSFGPTKTYKKQLENGIVHFGNQQTLADFPIKITDKLLQWAEIKPNHTFIGRRDPLTRDWVNLSYHETLEKVKNIAQYLLNLEFSPDETVVILSENSLEHALLVLASVHIGITYTPISPPYSLVSDDFGKLKHCLELMTPKVIFAQSGKVYHKAIELSKSLFPDAVIITADGIIGTHFEEMLQVKATADVEEAASKVNADTIAKVLFTSGSTGLPKGVMNHQGMWCANLQQITQVLPFMQEQPPIFIDWLPWNHTFGSNHNFGLALYNGGTILIDDGKPTPKGIEETVQNLREISPTAYFNVPKGFEMLIPYLENEPTLRENFFRNLNILFYAGASLAQPVWNRLEELALETIGVKIPIITGLGCTESGPSAMFANWGGAFSGLLGVPVAGMDVKLVPDGDKVEARYRASNVTKGYWRNPEATAAAFDEDGYYKTGDAVKFLDENNPDKGLVFDGRIAEDFKLSTGTWVNVGVLKAKVISTGSPIIQDVVLAGLDKEYIGAILFLNADACRKLANLESEISNKEAFQHDSVKAFINNWLEEFNKTSTGSSTAIRKYVIAFDPPSIDLGEITDKGSLNQRAVLKHRADLVNEMY